MTPEEIQDRIHKQGEISERDILEALSFYDDEDDAYVNMQIFLDGVTCISEDEKLRILGNIEEYAI